MDVRIDFKRIQQLQTQDIIAIQEYIFKCTAETAKSKAKTSVLFEQLLIDYLITVKIL